MSLEKNNLTLYSSMTDSATLAHWMATPQFHAFIMKQYLDICSPENFLATYLKLWEETLQTNGLNLMRGFEQWLRDFDPQTGRLHMPMTDMNAFRLGQNIAATKGHVIFKNDLMELIQYSPQTTCVRACPLLIIPPWINKYYILDLSPHNSLVNWLVAQGITVFMISWINPDAQHQQTGFFHYLQKGPIAAIEIIQRQLQVKQINTLGFCLGGTLLAMLLSFQQKNSSVRCATFLATMLDFSQPGDLAVYIEKSFIQYLEQFIQSKGYLPGYILSSAFSSLRSNELIWSFFVTNYLQGQTPKALDFLYWNADTTNLPASMYREYMQEMYINNHLIKPKHFLLNNVPLDLSSITQPSYFVATQKDHIAPWQSVYQGFLAIGGPKQFILGGSGHIAGIINPPIHSKYGYHQYPYAAKHPEQWLAKATHQEGSWWPAWGRWLHKNSGRWVKAPSIKNVASLMEAPGEYVHKRYLD